MRKFLVVWAFVGTQFIVSLPSFAQWVARYDGPGNSDDEASAIAVDNSGNVYVTGQSEGVGTEYDYATIKYDSSGVEQWVVRYDGPSNWRDYAYAIVVDNTGNVYVTGWSTGSGPSYDWDYATVKYNSSGIEQWVTRYDGPADSSDVANAIAVDGSGNVYVTGSSEGSDTDCDYATVKYNSSGVEQWVARYNGPGNWLDQASAIAVDGNYVYVTGGSMNLDADNDYATIKYNSSGDTMWVRRYNGQGNRSDVAKAIAVDGSGNVYVTGASYGSDTKHDYVTAKYNSSGVEQWVARYNGPDNRTDVANGIVVDKSGNIYITGKSEGLGPSFNYDYVTIKYNSSGVEQWVRRYNGPGNDDDFANAIAVDDAGNVYVTGESEGLDTDDDYATIKYNPSGDSVWVRRYNGPDNRWDKANAIAVDASGNVYVTGESYGFTTSWWDYATIKYSWAGVEEKEVRSEKQEVRLEVYPNPFTTGVRVQWSGVNEGQKVSLKVYDLGGRLVKTLLNNKVISGNKIEVNLEEFVKGIYFVKMEVPPSRDFASSTVNFIATKKIILMR